MRILSNTTSPYARIARIALAEKGFDLSGTRMLNPWADDAEMLGLNPASRVPTIITDAGLPITESLLILLWLERKVPEPSLLDGPLDRIVSQAGRAMGVIDAMVAIMIGVLQMDPHWGETRVGLRRRRSIVTGLRALDADPPGHAGGVPDIAVLTTVVALDYLRLRFPDAHWVEPLPALDALRAKVGDRPAYAATRPYL
ncbi:glutathione S-transferase family protein [Paracraurococcus ruber]|uniref:Glutathione S-transferase n=1 Tax=Paracraurococcus ruber TaxID=77675 RepID=A0ABS1CRX6_9PROT|nr:glutathione S-transferase family protein [Paracraurococcus ruber]MBK1657207.1 glutathione S-transferase [Paracraurococcus ruber]TDG32557.1 glutathione S-transferase family protein [Paracraurococcus ruber]